MAKYKRKHHVATRKLEQLLDFPPGFEVNYQAGRGERSQIANIFEKVQRALYFTDNVRIPTHIKPRKNASRIISDLEHLLQSESASIIKAWVYTRLENYLQQPQTKKKSGQSIETKLINDLNYVFASLAYCNSNQADIQQVLAYREQIDEDTKDYSMGEHFQQTFALAHYHGAQSSDLDLIAKLSSLDQAKQLNRLRSRALFGAENEKKSSDISRYPSFIALLRMIKEFDPKNYDEFSETADLFEEIPKNVDLLFTEGKNRSDRTSYQSIVTTIKSVWESYFSKNHAQLPHIRELIMTMYKEHNFLQGANVDIDRELQPLGLVTEQKRIAVVNLALQTHQYTAHAFAPAADQIFKNVGAHPELLKHYQRTLKTSKKVYRRWPKAFEEVNPSTLFHRMAGELDKNPELFSQQQRLRASLSAFLCNKVTSSNHAKVLLGMYTRSYEDQQELNSLERYINYFIDEKMITDYDSNYLSGDRENEFAKAMDNQISMASLYGTQSIVAIDQQLRAMEKANKQTRKESYFRKTRDGIFARACKIDSDASDIITGDYLINFLRLEQLTNAPSNSVRDAAILFMDRASELLQRTHRMPKDQQQEIYEKWMSGITATHDHPSVLRALHQNLPTTLFSEEESEYPLTDNLRVMQKIASAFGRTSYLVQPTAGITSKVTLPMAGPNTIYLPEYVKYFNNATNNEKVMRMLVYLQAGFSRFTLYGEPNIPVEKRTTSLQQSFGQFSNPSTAYRLFTILGYQSTRRMIQENHPLLATSLEETTKLLQPGHSKEKTDTLEGTIQALEEHLVFNSPIQGKAKVFMETQLLPYTQVSLDNIEDLLNATRELYQALDQKYKIPTDRQEIATLAFSNKEIASNIILPGQTGAAYNGQQIFFYDECGGQRQARVIIKQAASVPNSRVAEIKVEHSQNIQKIRRELESIKPQRVTMERRVHEGEINADAYFEAILEKRAGIMPEGNVFNHRRTHERDVSILLSVDQAKYLSKRLPDKTRPLDHIRSMLVYVSQAIQIIEDPLTILGYHSRGANEVFINVFKESLEASGMDIDYRIGLLSAQSKSRTGAVYKHIAHAYGQEAAAKKIHIDVVTRLADDDDYTGAEALQDIAQGARSERSKGIHLYALCLDQQATDQMLTDIYGTGHFKRVHNYAHLADTAVALYRTLALG